jgi:hypothetical protein
MASTQDTQTITSVDKDLALVKEQISFHERQAEVYASHPYRGKRHRQTAENFRCLLDRLQTLIAENQALTSGAPRFNGASRPKQFSLNLTPDDIEGLPDEVIKELGLNPGDRTDLAIVSLLEEGGGILSLDKILVGLYRRTKEVHKRQPLVQRLYRMSQKGMAFPVPGKKGVYSMLRLSEEEVERLFAK